MDVDNVHHHLAVVVPKTFHTPRPMSYWNGNERNERSTLPFTASGHTLWLHFSRAMLGSVQSTISRLREAGDG